MTHYSTATQIFAKSISDILISWIIIKIEIVKNHAFVDINRIRMNFWYLSFKSNEKDKSRRNIDKEEFKFSSRLFYIHPEYDETGDAQNFDICLIKSSIDENGIRRDLSSNFETIPCLPDALNLKKVLRKIEILISTRLKIFSGTWSILLGCRLGPWSVEWSSIEFSQGNRSQFIWSRLLFES